MDVEKEGLTVSILERIPKPVNLAGPARNGKRSVLQVEREDEALRGEPAGEG